MGTIAGGSGVTTNYVADLTASDITTFLLDAKVRDKASLTKHL